MLDPFFGPPALIARLVQPLANFLSLPTLPLHAHEILFAFTLYQLVNLYLSPALSSRLFPRTYPHLDARSKINWNVHSVSLVQSLLVNTLALWVIWRDDERRAFGWQERIWGYTGAAGLVQGFAAGYFLWDLWITSRYVHIFGWGMLAHAVCALVVFSFGFRPFVNYYGPVFILYELSSPLLNFHWYFDKLHMTGSRAQLYNGLALLATFFGCRLVWGPYQTMRVFFDVWKALRTGSVPSSLSGDYKPDPAVNATILPSTDATAEAMRFAGPQLVPLWLALTYLAANIVLTSLNLWWFTKMIDAVRKRFTKTTTTPAPITTTSVKGKGETEQEKEERTVMSGGGTSAAEANGDVVLLQEHSSERVTLDEKGRLVLEVVDEKTTTTTKTGNKGVRRRHG